jgi:hypothetical protein
VADGGLDLADGVGESERLLLGRAQDVKREPLRGALPDAGQAGELGDQAVDGCCEQTVKRNRLSGYPCSEAGEAEPS